MNRLQLKEGIATAIQLARRAAPAAAVASGLFGSTASGAPGDLDPAFANVGRAYPLPGLDGTAWSIQAQGEDDFILAGGDHYAAYYSYYESSTTGFTRRLSGNGSIDQTFAALSLADTEVLDVVVQADGRVVGVGRTAQGTPKHFVLTVFRLEPDGALDPTFGEGGIVHLGADSVSDLSGTSVALDSGGRIVVAGLTGTWAGSLVVARFLDNGAIDASFGVDGFFSGPMTQGHIAHPQILRTSDGRFRVTTNLQTTGPDPNLPVQFCSVVGLTADGALDASFGNAGLADISDAGAGDVTCNALAVQPGGGLLVAGSDSGHGMVVRLVADGTIDSGFSATSVAADMVEATALGVDQDGLVLVAGRGAAGISGALVVRLQAGGQLDALFGNSGSTWVDLPPDPPGGNGGKMEPWVRDVAVLPDGGALLAGGALYLGYQYYGAARPFAARLLGTGGGDGPGVLGIERREISATEQGQNAIVTVRRMGGDSGAVSVAYATQVVAGDSGGATAGEDYTTVTGRLTWADGDASDQQITVPITADGAAEGPESFAIFLDDLQGGAGLGTDATTVQIAADPEFLGTVSINDTGTIYVNEGAGYVAFRLNLAPYRPGAVSVTLAMTPGTAKPGADYVADPITVSWPEGSSGLKVVQVPIIDDKFDERPESFTVTLVNPSQGVTLGAVKTATITIQDNDRKSSGGGAFGFASWLLLAVLGVLRPRPRAHDRVQRRTAT